MSKQKATTKVSADDQLSDLESRLTQHATDEAMLAAVGSAMRMLLTREGDSEAKIRKMLQRRFDEGHIRAESYELIRELLGKIASEERTIWHSTPPEDVAYEKTTVLKKPSAKTPPAKNAAKELKIGSVLRDRFLLKEQVPEGSMGVVYKALDSRLAETGELDPYVAIKILSPNLSRNATALRALQQEAAKGRCLSHPNIVRFIDFDREGDMYFIVMEWLEGRSLSRILDDNNTKDIDFTLAMDIVRQTASALEYAHQRGVIHADIKPGNIFILPEGQVKLIDFGVARVRQKANEGRSRLDPNALRGGTPAYSSMQVLTGEDPVPADDVFSLACLMYRLVAGHRVFGPRNAAEAAEEGMEPQRPQSLEQTQWMALKKALSYSRVTRFKSPAEFIAALGNAQPGSASKMADPENQASPNTASKRSADVRAELPMRAVRESRLGSNEFDAPRRSIWRIAVIALIMVGAVAIVVETRLLERFAELDIESAFLGVGGTNDDYSAVTPPAEGYDVEQVAPTVAEPVQPVDDSSRDSDFTPPDEELAAPDASDEISAAVDEPGVGDGGVFVPPAVPAFEPTDFSLLPPPDLLVELPSSQEEAIATGALTLREDGPSGTLDLVRRGDVSDAFSVRLVESQSPGNRSAWEAGQYTFENDGLLTFAPGEPRARIGVSMRPDPVREPDYQLTVDVRDVTTSANLATLSLTLEDDDQRAFESNLAVNTVGFAVNQVSVRESDAAVLIDVIRYRPDDSILGVRYFLTDVTATEGEDYFSPSVPVVEFAAGQRSARILIPLGQDARPEADEAFMLELVTEPSPVESNIFSQIAVMIRDDDN